MWAVRVPRQELLGRIKENRENHKEVVAEALEGYRVAVIEELEKRIDQIKAGKKIDTYVRLPQPEDHTIDYTTVIGMLEMSTEETVTLGPDEYASFVEDRWDWRDRWIQNTASYTSSAKFANLRGE